jgi:osmotically-inducible protein OsmY
MRRDFVGLAILAIAALAPTGAFANDRQIAQEIVKRLQHEKDEGALKDFSIDVQVNEGIVTVKGNVSEASHEKLALDIASRVDGVRIVYDLLEVSTATSDEPRPIAQAQPANGGVLTRLHKAFQLTALESPEADDAARTDSKRIAQEIAKQMRAEKESGNLKGFGVEVEVDQATVWLRGYVSNADQEALALDIARNVEGVDAVVNELTIKQLTRTVAARGPNLAPEQLLVDERPRSLDAVEGAPADELAQEVLQRLRKQQDEGNLRGFAIDIDVRDATVWLSGRVTSQQQLDLVLEEARYVPGVELVVNDLEIAGDATQPTLANEPQLAAAEIPTSTAVGTGTTPAAPAPPVAANQPAQALYPTYPYAYAPVQYMAPQAAAQPNSQTPLAFAPAHRVNYQTTPHGGGTYQPAAPVPMAAPGVGATPARYDHPQMPGYAWPSYAAHPNYGAVTYPRQYSASAWPYIGPFYPYPQVPLGWRKVTLEWDDGWWFLDFKDRYHH